MNLTLEGVRAALAGLVAMLLICGAAAQQNRDRAGAGVSVGPAGDGAPPPRLGAPLNGEAIRTQAAASTAVMFSWVAPAAAGAPAPQRYRLCVFEQGASCAAPGALIYEAGQATRHQADIPPRFHNRMLAWTVAACGPGYGSGAAQNNTPDADCSWGEARSLDARSAR
jgi:hypothetical protein